MIWIDLRTNTTIGAIVHFDFGQSTTSGPARRLLLWSSDVDAQHLPDAFMTALSKWNAGTVRIDPSTDRATALTVGAAFVEAHFVDRDGTVSALDALSAH